MPTRDTPSPQGATEEKTPKNKPKRKYFLFLSTFISASRLRQQKLPAWQPILTASTVIPSVMAVGVIFIPIGIALFLASESGLILAYFLLFWFLVKEYKVDYTDCGGNPCLIQMNVTEDMTVSLLLLLFLEYQFREMSIFTTILKTFIKITGDM